MPGSGFDRMLQHAFAAAHHQMYALCGQRLTMTAALFRSAPMCSQQHLRSNSSTTLLLPPAHQCCATPHCLQPQGLLKASGGLQPSLLIDSSTILPTYTSELAQRICTYSMLAPGARKVAGAPGPVFVDAPVSGGVIGAVAGTVTFMVSEHLRSW
jgi:hypothetical protein